MVHPNLFEAAATARIDDFRDRANRSRVGRVGHPSCARQYTRISGLVTVLHLIVRPIRKVRSAVGARP
jgi:hypothetical protein